MPVISRAPSIQVLGGKLGPSDPAPLTQQLLPVSDEDFGQGHHLLVRAVLADPIHGNSNPGGLQTERVSGRSGNQDPLDWLP